MRRTVLILLSGLSLACLMMETAFAKTTPVERSSPPITYSEYIAEAAQRFALPSAWLHAVMRGESGGNPLAVSPKGAIGLMQIMPKTWAELRIRHRLGGNAYDPHDNIMAGAAYIRDLFDRFGLPGWIAAYNAGPKRFEASLKGRQLPAETRAYVAKVLPDIHGNDVKRPILVTAMDRSSWTRAPLFATQPDSTSVSSSVSVERVSRNRLETSPLRDVSGITPQSTGLFVTRMSTGDRQ